MDNLHYSADENDGTLNRTPKIFNFRAPALPATGRGKKTPAQKAAEEEYTNKIRVIGLPMTPSQIEEAQSAANKAPEAGVVESARKAMLESSKRPRLASWLGDARSLIFRENEVKHSDPEIAAHIEKGKEWEQKVGEHEWAQMDARTHNKRASDTDTYGTECEGCHNPNVVGTCHNCRERIRDEEDGNPIRIPPIFEPQEHHEIFAQCDHDPTIPCEKTPHGPLGHIVTVWNGDGAIGGLSTRGRNIGMITGLVKRDPKRTKVLSDAALNKHHELCDHYDGPTVAGHHPECPIGFHMEHCAKHNPNLPFAPGAPQQAWLHAANCPINDMTETGEYVPGQTQFHITLLDQKNPGTKGKLDYGRAKIRHDSFTQNVTSDPIGPSDPLSPKERTYHPIETVPPEWQQAGIGGMRRGVVVNPDRVIHVPSSAVKDHLTVNERTGKADMRQFFGEQEGVVGGRPTTASFMAYLKNPFGSDSSSFEKLKRIQPIATIMGQLQARKDNPKLWDTPMESSEEKTFEPGQAPLKPKMDISKLLPKKSYVHVTDEFQRGVPCRFCDDPSNTNGKGEIIQTGTDANGRPLYAHEECDNPFAFAENFRTLPDDGIVEVDFIPSTIAIASYNYGITPETRKIDTEIGIDTPSAPARIDPGIPENANKMPKLPKVEKMTRLKSTNLGDNGQAIPPAK